MTNDTRIARLQRLAELVKQADLAELATKLSAREQTAQRLAALGEPPLLSRHPRIEEVTPVQKHAQWHFNRRVELNRTLALQTAECLQSRGRALRAVGRAGALEKLAHRLSRRQAR